MKTSENGIRLIKAFESYRSVAYKATSGGNWTVGWGAEGSLSGGKVITQGTVVACEEANNAFIKDLVQKREPAVQRIFGDTLKQCEWDAIISRFYNFGNNSSLHKDLKNAIDSKDRNAIETSLMKGSTAGGQRLQGLVIRRMAEKDLFFSGALNKDTTNRYMSKIKLCNDTGLTNDIVSNSSSSSNSNNKEDCTKPDDILDSSSEAAYAAVKGGITQGARCGRHTYIYFSRWNGENYASGRLTKGSTFNGNLLNVAQDTLEKLADKAKREKGVILNTTGAYRSFEKAWSMACSHWYPRDSTCPVAVNTKTSVTWDSSKSMWTRPSSTLSSPGTSNHGWGRAIDFKCFTKYGINNNKNNPHFKEDFYLWMCENAPLYGWVNPPWASAHLYGQKNNGPFEPWHWEFVGLPLPKSTSDRPNNPAAGGGEYKGSGVIICSGGNAPVGNTNQNPIGNDGEDLTALFKDINSFLFTGQSISDAVEDKKEFKKTKADEEKETRTILNPVHTKDKIIAGMDPELK